MITKGQHIFDKLRRGAARARIAQCAACVGLLGLTSCGDFLELQPLNDIVLENYWTEKADVQSVIYSCYSGLASDDVLERMLVWGEVRSDNIQRGASVGGDLQLVLRENILATSGYSKWDAFYKVINRCNTVIEFAPQVAAKDPNYTVGELHANIAEATALRSLCYFYLIRAFRDVPYVTTPSSDDNDIDTKYRVEASSFKAILAELIASLEAVRDDAVTLYPDAGYPVYEDFNSGRITKSGIDALLCELYLWNGDYAKCMEAADRVLAFKYKRYKELREKVADRLDVQLYDECYPLIPELKGTNQGGNAYDYIFGEGHSFESIFELGYMTSYTSNSVLTRFYGSSTSHEGSLFASEAFASGLYDGGNENWTYDDCRYAAGIDASDKTNNLIRKYVLQSCDITLGTDAKKEATIVGTYRSTSDANWIIYRLTDVMLMKAEAAVELSATTGVDSLDAAFQIAKVINQRARKLEDGSPKILKRTDYNSIDAVRQLVQDERRRELMFEGKRWFDLVRVALREGDNTNLVNQVVKKHTENTNVIRIKLRTQDALFWPINQTELDVNPHLHQNPAYKTDEVID